MNARFFSVRLLLALLFAAGLTPAAARAQSAREQIRLNQIGFYPEATKVAVVAGTTATTFHVATPDLADTVFTGTLSQPRSYTPAAETVRRADFTAFQTPGTYVVTVPGLGASYPFEISPAVHQGVARGALRGFYYQRASTRLQPRHADRWARSAGHPDTQVLVHPSAASDARPAGTVLAAPRGWYDAGDYNKYIVNSGITTGTLLMLFEHFPAYFSALDLNIPESGNGVPDLLDEVLWNLRWMLAMQDPNDGGVYHKLSNANFDGMVMPAQANTARYVVQKSTAATLDFAAVTAMAARIYDGYEAVLPGLADSCRAAARAAWQWALENQEEYYVQNDVNAAFNPDLFTGEYGDRNVLDEFRWAAAELYITTGSDTTLFQFDPFRQTSLGVPGWGDVGTMAFVSLAHHRANLTSVVDTAEVKRRLVNLANTLVAYRRDSAYDMVMGRSGDFFWGSSSFAANQGFILLQAYRMTGEERYRDAALSNLDYLLGRNALGYSFLTGFGDKTPMHPHHRPSEADGIADPVPGLLSGGPNADAPRQGETCPSYIGRQPATTFTDHVCSYASNEIAINWNAPMAYLSGALEALFSPTGQPVAVEEGPGAPVAAPQGFALASYPNPMGRDAVVTFTLPEAAPVTVVVYDLLGRAVAHVAAPPVLAAGTHRLAFDAAGLARGAYVLRLAAGGRVASRLILVAP